MALASRWTKVWHGLPHLLSLVSNVLKERKIGLSYDVTDRCPLKCEHCYQVARRQTRELTVPEAVQFVRQMKKQGMQLLHCVGGEPILRPDLLNAVAGILPAMWVATSGLHELFHLPKTTWFLSVDGADAATHDKMRGCPGLFNRILKNLASFRKQHSDPVFVHAVLTERNFLQVDEIMSFWKQNGMVDGIVFSVATPQRNNLIQLSKSLSPDDRMWLIDQLLMLKKQYGDFLCMSRAMIHQLSPDIVAAWNPGNCATAHYVYSADPLGQEIRQCIFGPQGDCSRCGCVVQLATETVLDFETIRMLGRLYNPLP